MSTTDIVADIFDRFARNGHREYGESVTQEQHALQTAHLAEQDGADDLLVAAALLHDFGHLLHDEDAAAKGIDAIHEQIGAKFLSQHFAPEVVEPGRLHVQAKRYLCAVSRGYHATLSPASVRSLELQGGPFTADEINAFRQNPHWKAAVRLRHWDDGGKDPQMQTPPLEHYRSHVAAGLQK